MIEIQFNSNVRETVQAINENRVEPWIQYQNIRYHLSTKLAYLGYLVYTPFDVKTGQPLGYSLQYRYGMQSTFSEAILGPGPRAKTPIMVDVALIN